MPRKKSQPVPAPQEPVPVPGDVPAAVPEVEEPMAGASAGLPAPEVAPSEDRQPPLPPVVEPAPYSEHERQMAALAHGSILLNLVTGLGGAVIALLVYLFYDRKSEYVSWHALQSLVFQGASLLLTLVLSGISAVLWLIALPLTRVVVGYCLVPFALSFTLLTIVVALGSLIYGIAGALAVLEGRDFRYRWISDLIPPLTRP